MADGIQGFQHGLTNYGDRDFSLYLRRSFLQLRGTFLQGLRALFLRLVGPALVAQLGEGGVMVIPIGSTFDQELRVMRKTGNTTCTLATLPVRFVPMVKRSPGDA